MLYKYQDGNGQTIYSDRAPNPNEAQGQVIVFSGGSLIRREEPTPDKEASPYEKGVGYINQAKSHIPKIQAYVEYIEYLRKMQPARYMAYANDLAKNDPASYANLKKAGLFHPLKQHQRLSALLDASVAVGGDLFTGQSGFSGVTTYAEKTLLEYMKRDGFLPGDVLGAKTSTLPRSVPKSSMPQLTQWSQQQAARNAQASKTALDAVAGRPVLAAGATAATRVAGPVLDAMIGVLDPQVYSGLSAMIGPRTLANDLKKRGIMLNDDEMLYLPGFFARNDWAAIRELVREAALRSKK